MLNLRIDKHVSLMVCREGTFMQPRRRFGPRYKVPRRRRREGKTDYRARYKMAIGRYKYRAVVRKTNRYIIVHFTSIELGGDRTYVYVTSKILRKFGWPYSCKCLPAAYLTGYIAGLLALKKGIKEAILDIGLFRSTRGNRLYAALKGMLDAGVRIPHDPVIFPSEERIRGEHIVAYAKLLKEKEPERYKRQFGGYLKIGADPEKIPEVFEKTLEAIKRQFGVVETGVRELG